MSIANRSNLDGVSTEFKALYDEVFLGGDASPVFDACVDVHDMAGMAQLEIPFGNDGPEPQEWDTTKVHSDLSAAKLTIPVKPYYKATKISIVDWSNQSYAQKMLRAFLSTEKAFIEKLLIDKLVRADTDLGYDGVAFCGTTHAGNGADQDNHSTTAFSRAQLVSTVAAMRAFTSPSGIPLDVQPDTLIVGPKLEDAARDAVFGSLKSLSDTTAIDNQKPVSKLIVSNRLVGTTDDYWFVVDSRPGRRPLNLGIKERPTPKDDVGQYLREGPEYSFALEGQLAIGYGLWQSCFGNFVA